jgi:1-deoxy-D-xylulose-5-phosphate reductoisomerase
MKKKIAILGSTGSIGKTLINILKKDKENFEIVLLTADKNYKELLKQAKTFNVKNIILTNKDLFLKINKKRKVNKVKYLQ